MTMSKRSSRQLKREIYFSMRSSKLWSEAQEVCLRRWRVEKSIPDHFVQHCADHVCVASMIILLFISLIHER
jgi:hypothetical protein